MGDADSIQKLSSMKSLRELTVANIDNFDAAVLGKFTGLTSLEMEIAMDGDGGLHRPAGKPLFLRTAVLPYFGNLP